jgi:DNA repair protein REV1
LADLRSLHKALVQHGAGFLQYLDGKTMATHIIASALPPKKAAEYSRYRIVKPAWVVDSIQAGKLLPWGDYRVVDDGPRQKVLAFGDGNVLTQATPKPTVGYREQTDNSFYTSQFKSPAIKSNPSAADSPMLSETYTPSLQPLTEARAAESFSGGIDDSLFDEIDLDTPSKSLAPIVPSAQPKTETPSLPSPQKPDSEVTAKPPEGLTSEEHNAWLLSDPKIRKSSTANPDFLKQFYSESRLHHLSTWKAELKSRMQRLAKEKEKSIKVARRRPGSRRYILHVDFDSFFCAVSLKKHPQYVDKPTVIAHSAGLGSEIASCNYPARKFGVKNGMWMKKALEFCPDLKVLPYDFPAYEEASQRFYEAILEIGAVVQSVSVDEALLDVTAIINGAVDSLSGSHNEADIPREQEVADEMALKLRNDIRSRTGCDVSVGIGGNILQAKVALRKGKPAGQFQLKPEDVLDVLGELEVKDLPGVAHSISGKLEEIGIKHVKDMRQASKEKLSGTLGPKTGEKLWEYARGIDRTEVGEQPSRKSVSAEVNWGIRFISQPEAEEFVMNLCKELERRLLNEQVKGRQLTMKIMRRSQNEPLDPVKHLGHGKCDTFNKSVMFGVATNSAEIIGKEAVAVLRSFKFSPGDLRGLGVQLTKLDPLKQGASTADSSQRRLNFAPFGGQQPSKRQKLEQIDEYKGSAVMDSPKLSRKSTSDDIEDDGSPQHKRSSGRVEEDPIADDPLTPRKPKSVHPALALAQAGERDKKATTSLNIAGTQFILPSNADPSILAELPSSIRAKLQAQHKQSPFLRAASPASRPRSESPAIGHEPLPSQVDPEVFHALPDDMKVEVLAMYGRQPTPAAAPFPPPESPRRDRTALAPRNRTPTKRGGIRASRGRARERQQDAAANRMQTSFAPIRAAPAPVSAAADDDIPEDLDPTFLAELPEDVRREVIEDHRRKRLAKKSGLSYDAHPRRPVGESSRAAAPAGQTKLHFPAPPAKIAFSGTSFTAVQDIKDMLEAWYGQSKDDGPHEADVEVFEKYLARVVLEEKDMAKTVKLVGWLGFLASADPANGMGKQVWLTALDDIKSAVQAAVRKRGLAPLKF